MSETATQSFDGLNQNAFTTLRAIVQEKTGIQLNGVAGKAGRAGVAVQWSYDAASQHLDVTITRQFFDPQMATLEADLSAAVEQAKAA
jgi:hypothetical protein